MNLNKTKRMPTSKKDKAIKKTVSWVAPEYHPHEKGLIWNVLMSVAWVLFILYGLYHNSWTMALSFFLVGVVYYLVHKEKDKTIKIELTDLGINVGKYRKYSFSHIKAFWIIHHPPFISTLNFQTKKKIMSQTTVQLGDQDPIKVRNFLVKQIPEWEGKEESFSDLLARIFKI